MDRTVGRAGFHATHTKALTERGAILHEMMRELDPAAVAYWAKRNPNIVVADEVLDEAMVNDGAGGFTRCIAWEQVLDYGAARVRRVKRKIRADSEVTDRKTGEKAMKGGTVTTTMIVSHLPKSMCVEVPRAYAVVDAKTGMPRLGADGEPMRRSRWVARDRDEARRFFQDVVDFIGTMVPGGQAGILAYDIQHSESTPHVQILADTFGEDPKDKDALTAQASQAWFTHRDVRDANGKVIRGKSKLRDYHARLKAHLIDCGYDISADFDEDRHLSGMAKDEYMAMRDLAAAVKGDMIRVDEGTRELAARQAQLTADKNAFDDREHAIVGREATVSRQEAEIPQLARAAESAGYRDGEDEGYRTGFARGHAKGRDEGLGLATAAVERDRAEARHAAADASAARDRVRAEAARLRALREEIERDLDAAGRSRVPMAFDDIREDLIGRESSVAIRYLRSLKLSDGTTAYDRFESWARSAYSHYAGKRTVTFDAWKERTVAAQRNIVRAHARAAQLAEEDRQPDGRRGDDLSFGR